MSSTICIPSNAGQAVVFGANENLVGICVDPTHQSIDPDFAVVLVTPGMLHSAGPYRLHVSLAGALAERGIRSLRFDLSGIGESLPVGGAGNSLNRASSEIGAAIDWLAERWGVKRVALFGLCAGADDAIFAALEHERVCGLFAIDGCGYRTSRFYWHRLLNHYLPKAVNPRKWTRWLKGAWGLQPPAPASLQVGSDIREFPNRAVAATQLLQLAQRGVRMHFYYTGGVSDYYNYQNQFEDMFPELEAVEHKAAAKHVEHVFVPESDHTAFLIEHRHDLIDSASRFLGSLASDQPHRC